MTTCPVLGGKSNQLCDLLDMEIHDDAGGVHAEHRHIGEPHNDLQHLLRIGLELCGQVAGTGHARMMAAWSPQIADLTTPANPKSHTTSPSKAAVHDPTQLPADGHRVPLGTATRFIVYGHKISQRRVTAI